MKRFVACALLLAGGAGCTEAPISVPLRSLERSGDVSFVCVGADGTGRDIDSCPDFENQDQPNHLYAMVTQTLRGEVAVIDLSRGRVLDLDKSTPGFDFLPVGAQPIDIVSSPTGEATFVGVGEVGKEGIFALPTTCVKPPTPDLAEWPACALPAAPGDMVIVADPLAHAACDSGPGSALSVEPSTECPGAALAQPYKLIVSLPALGELWIIDAQELLSRPQGSFEPCTARPVEFKVDLPAGHVPQDVPEDLVPPAGCTLPELNNGPPSQSFISQPGGFALSDGTLYVADRGAPVIHAFDVSSPCTPARLPPLLPKSYENPGRVVTTSRVAVSPATTKGERFVYAIDELEGSVMAFDVTPGKLQRTPLVRPGTPRLPFEPADRIAFASPARDLAFVLRDLPIVDENGVATIGTYCDPVNNQSPGAAYRPALDFARGAAPRELRGVFGFIALASGQVAVIDVEDFDAPCRRPVTSNSASVEDFKGCESDPTTPEFYTVDGTAEAARTVTGEVTCDVVQKHRARSASLLLTGSDVGVHAPGLRAFPQLRDASGGALASGNEEEGRLVPKLLAVDFPNPENGSLPAQVYVGNTLHSTASTENELIIDPDVAERPSVALVWNQPRAFAPEEDFTLTYEGAFIDRQGAHLDVEGQDELTDGDANYCGRGVQDFALTREVGEGLGVGAAADAATKDDLLDKFADRHADYVQITSNLLPEDDIHWKTATCGGVTGRAAFLECKNRFGTAETPSPTRDLRILEAYQSRLVVEARVGATPEEKQATTDLLHCCFGKGSALKYQVRVGHQWALVGSGSGFRHDVTADPANGFRCIRDCAPRRQHLQSRAFEVSSDACQEPGEDDPPSDCPIGYATGADLACVIPGSGPLTPDGSGSECIFQNLTHRFAVYRGNQPSERDMAFAWQTVGGFTALSANLAAQTAAVSPQSLVFVPQLGQLAVVDGAAEGLVLVSLESVSVSRLFF